jgi:hypothetical protein
MSATAPKPSWHWGATPRRIKWTVGVLFLLLLGSLFVIAIFGERDFFWKFEATNVASQAGATDAKMFYSRGSHRLLEIALINEDKPDTGPIAGMYEMKPAGRQADGCEIYFLYQSPTLGTPHRITQESYLRAFNHMMRTMCANPKWFGPHGERLQPDEGQTNRPPFKAIPQ